MQEAADAARAPQDLRSGERPTLRRVAWSLTALMTLGAAGFGVAFPAVYEGLVEEPYLPGAHSQDAMSLGAALVLLGLALAARDFRPKLELVVLGLLGYLVYAYGIYVIERVYNSFYLAIWPSSPSLSGPWCMRQLLCSAGQPASACQSVCASFQLRGHSCSR